MKVSGQVLAPATLPPRKETPEDRVGLRTGLAVLEKIKFSFLAGTQTARSSTVQPTDKSLQ
jgi:hypothetical protein